MHADKPVGPARLRHPGLASPEAVRLAGRVVPLLGGLIRRSSDESCEVVGPGHTPVIETTAASSLFGMACSFRRAKHRQRPDAQFRRMKRDNPCGW